MKRMVLILAIALTGCWRMTVRNGSPVGATPIEYDNKWHSGLIYGLAELSGPYDLSKVCPQGWSEIHTETPLVQGLVQALTLQIYNPQGVTIRCAGR
jgi:hypothetical protein